MISNVSALIVVTAAQKRYKRLFARVPTETAQFFSPKIHLFFFFAQGMNNAEEEIVSARSNSTSSLPVQCNSHQDSSRQDSLHAAQGILKTVYMIPAFRYNVGSWFNVNVNIMEISLLQKGLLVREQISNCRRLSVSLTTAL